MLQILMVNVPEYCKRYLSVKKNSNCCDMHTVAKENLKQFKLSKIYYSTESPKIIELTLEIVLEIFQVFYCVSKSFFLLSNHECLAALTVFLFIGKISFFFRSNTKLNAILDKSLF